MWVTEFECYKSRLPTCQQCRRRTKIFFFGTVQPSTCIFIRQGCRHPVNCFKKNIVRLQQNYNIKTCNTDTECNRKHGAGNSNIWRKSRNKEEEISSKTGSKCILLVTWEQGHLQPYKQYFQKYKGREPGIINEEKKHERDPIKL